MAESKAFIEWFLSALPNFLLAAPINQFLGFAFLAVTIRLFKSLINVAD